jgi:hypothetical protein
MVPAPLHRSSTTYISRWITPELFYLFPSDEFMRDEALLSKLLGLNCNSIDIKVEIPRKLDLADRLALLIMVVGHNWCGCQAIPRKKTGNIA